MSVSVSAIVSPLTFALDLGQGQPMGHSVRRCLLGMRLAKEIGLPQGESCDLYYTLLMKDAGAAIGGVPARIVRFAETLAAHYAACGPAPGLEVDPELACAAKSLAARDGLWPGMDEASRRVIEIEPDQKPFHAPEAALDDICYTFSDAIDAKSPLGYRHSIGVAETAVFIARTLGLNESDVTLLRRAALLHDIGKLGVSTAILAKPGKLTAEEWVEVRKHVAYSYAILKRVPGFGELSEIAGAHHEKLDGSGYFRGLTARQLTLPMRILAVADIYDALSSKRPYRDALPRELALQIMQRQTPHALDATCFEALMGSLNFEASLARLSANLQH